MLTDVVLFAVNILLFLAAFLYFRGRIRAELDAKKVLKEIGDEVDALILDLNQATDRDIGLVEQRMEALRALLDEADRRIKTARRETDAREREAGVYGDLRPRQARPARTAGESAIELDFGAARREYPSAAGAAAAAQGGRVAPEPEELAAEPAIAAHPDRPSSRPVSHSAASYGASSPAAEAGIRIRRPTATRADDLVPRAPSLRDEVRELHRRGISAEMIAKKLGKTVGEIDLIVALPDRGE